MFMAILGVVATIISISVSMHMAYIWCFTTNDMGLGGYIPFVIVSIAVPLCCFAFGMGVGIETNNVRRPRRARR